jgi:hypothetical protein
MLECAIPDEIYAELEKQLAEIPPMEEHVLSSD